MAKVADRLDQVAHNTQTLGTRLELQLAERFADRDGLTMIALMGPFSATTAGSSAGTRHRNVAWLRCSQGGRRIEEQWRLRVMDHSETVARLNKGVTVDRIGRHCDVPTAAPFASLRRRDFCPHRAATRSAAGRGLTDKAAWRWNCLARVLKRRAGSAEMAPQIEAALADLRAERRTYRGARAGPVSRETAVVLQPTPGQTAGFLSLNDAIVRSEELPGQAAGGAIDWRFSSPMSTRSRPAKKTSSTCSSNWSTPRHCLPSAGD